MDGSSEEDAKETNADAHGRFNLGKFAKLISINNSSQRKPSEDEAVPPKRLPINNL